jgi:hypothetical protein
MTVDDEADFGSASDAINYIQKAEKIAVMNEAGAWMPFRSQVERSNSQTNMGQGYDALPS